MSRSKHLIALALALACTPRENDVESGLDREVEPEPVSSAEPAEPRQATKKTPPRRVASVGPVPGFVLYTEDHSILVPSDGSVPVIGEGLWIQDDRSEPAPITHTLVLSPARADAMKVPGRACHALAGSCTYGTFESRSFDPQTGSILAAPASSCTSFHRPEAIGFPAMELEGEQLERCADLEVEAIGSLAAGKIYLQGWDWNGACRLELSIYDAYAIARSLIHAAPDLDDVGMRLLGCDNEFGRPELRPWPFDEHGLVECEDDIESESESNVYALRRGDLWKISTNMSGTGGWRAYAKRPVRPDTCPSINDPCGDPEPFRARAALDQRQREFWIATDGSAALSAEQSTYALWQAGRDTPLEFELAGFDATTDVIGVRVHADLRRLRGLIAQHPGLGFDRAERAPATVDAEACLELDTDECEPGRSASAWSEECLDWIELEQWTRAEEACLCGLAVADVAAASRGALLYDLGLIAEAQGALEQAAMQYRESLRLRPGNALVQQRLAKLALADSRLTEPDEVVAAALEGR